MSCLKIWIAVVIICGQPFEVLAEPITIIRPTISFEESTTVAGSEVDTIVHFLEALPIATIILPQPLRRANTAYTLAPQGCILFTMAPITDQEVSTKVLSVAEYWFYGLRDKVRQKDFRLRVIGMVLGAENYFDPAEYGEVVWRFAPSYHALAPMLEAGRVDAIPANPQALAHPALANLPLVKAAAKPFLELNLAIRCKETPETVRFVEAVNEAWQY